MMDTKIIKQFPLLFCLLITACFSSEKLTSEHLNKGKELAFTRSKGNCLACHIIADGELSGNLGPELKNLKGRFNNKGLLRQFIWDATVFNSKTAMPPFGKNKILSEQEIDMIIDYLWQL